MAIGGVVINFVAKTADAIGDVKKLDKSLGGLSDGAKKSGGKLSGFVSNLSGSLPVVGAVIAGVAGATAALVDMGKAAWEDKQQADKLANTLGNIPGVTQAMIDKNEEWITSMQLATLVSDTDLRNAIGKLTLATGDLGTAQTLATLATDVAAGSGKNFTTVADAMAKAAAGNTSQLERMFPWLDKNKDGTVTLAEATKGLGTAFAGASAEAAKNDPWKRIGIIWDELKESVGGALIPVLDRLSDWFSKKSTQVAIQNFIDKTAELAETVGVKVVDAFEDLIAWLKQPANQQKLRDWADLAGRIATAMGQAADAVITLIGWLNSIPDVPIPTSIWDIPGLFPGVNTTKAAPTATTRTTSGARTTTAPVTINFNGPVGDPHAVARELRRVLRDDQHRLGRVVTA